MPNDCWQSGFTHYPLADGPDTEILTWLDDHSRYALSLTAHHRVTGPAVLLAFRAACARHGTPASSRAGYERALMLTLHGRVSAWYAAHRIRIITETATSLTSHRDVGLKQPSGALPGGTRPRPVSGRRPQVMRRAR
jgi:hypothetical protein